MVFNRYKRKPTFKVAAEITEKDVLERVDVSSYKYKDLLIKTYDEPKVGDFVVYYKKDEVYHVPREKFLQKYIVE